jgi:hypothetical protein
MFTKELSLAAGFSFKTCTPVMIPSIAFPITSYPSILSFIIIILVVSSTYLAYTLIYIWLDFMIWLDNW